MPRRRAGFHDLKRLTKKDGGLGYGEDSVLGIDASLTGHAVVAVSVEDPTRYYGWLFQPQSKGTRRLVDIQTYIEGITNACDPKRVKGIVMEGYAFSRGANSRAHSIGEGGGATKLALLDALGHDNPQAYPSISTPSSVKKFATGKGNAKKNEMLLGVYKKWDVEWHDDNLCDAYVMARIALALHLGATPALKYEEEALAKVELTAGY